MPRSISVIVTHYNRPKLVREALDSIGSQTVPVSEIVLVDDCSTPENRESLNAYSSIANIVSTPRNLGPSGAVNLGAQVAKGEWLCFLGDDDLYFPDKIEREVLYLDAHPTAEAVGGGVTMMTHDGHTEYWGGTRTGRMNLSD